MPNNHTQDLYRPDGIGSEFEEHEFSEVNEGEIFRLNADNKDQSLYRKENEIQAMDIKTRVLHNIAANTKIYIKI
jgi:hypothetical protein